MHTSEVKARDTSSRSESAEAEHSPDREPRMARAENFYRATERTERVAEFFFSWPLLQPSFGFALETLWGWQAMRAAYNCAGIRSWVRAPSTTRI